MNTITVEEANAFIDQLLEEVDSQEQTPNDEDSASWKEKRPLS